MLTVHLQDKTQATPALEPCPQEPLSPMPLILQVSPGEPIFYSVCSFSW